VLRARELDVRLSNFPPSPLIFGFQLFLKFLKFSIFDFRFSIIFGFLPQRISDFSILVVPDYLSYGFQISGKTVFRKNDFQEIRFSVIYHYYTVPASHGYRIN
jgi:hypothetical protein